MTRLISRLNENAQLVPRAPMRSDRKTALRNSRVRELDDFGS